MTLIVLMFEFLKVGLFAVGGGVATLPFLYKMAESHPAWFTAEKLGDIIAVAQSLPGPLGVNSAIAAGYSAAGAAGGVVAAVGVVLPSIFIIIAISSLLTKFSNNKFVTGAFYGLRPAVAALILYAWWHLAKAALVVPGASRLTEMLNPLNIAIAVGFFLLIKKLKLHPIVYIIAGAAVGMLLKM